MWHFVLKRTRLFIALVLLIVVTISFIEHKLHNRWNLFTPATILHTNCDEVLVDRTRTLEYPDNRNSPLLRNPWISRRLEAIQSTSSHPRWHRQTCAELCTIRFSQTNTQMNKMNSSQLTAKSTLASCLHQSKHGTAVIIPIEQPVPDLFSLISPLSRLLREQNLCYRIFVVEHGGDQNENYNNIGVLMNVGFIEAASRFETNCIVFHDPFLKLSSASPRHTVVPHYCDSRTNRGPVHMSVMVNGKLAPSRSLAGVLRIRPQHFILLNGFSNWYWNMSGVYEDFERRIRANGMEYDHENIHNVRYTTSDASFDFFDNLNVRTNEIAWFLIDHAAQRMDRDGLRQLIYRTLSITDNSDYTHVVVNSERMVPSCSSNRS